MTLPLITEGYLTLDPNLPGAPKKPLQTWYAIYGDLRSTNPETHTLPLVILHGGPGGGHSYLKRYAERLTMTGAPCSAVILYDSIGCGNSTPLNDMDNHDVAAFLTLSLHVYELDALIHHLGIQDAFHMLGHSYGGFLAAHYAATHQPPPRGLNRLILQSSPASFPLWDEAQMDLRRQLPPDIQDTIARCEAGHITADSTEFQQAITEFTRRHFCRVLDNPPQEFSDAIAIMVANPTVVETMSVSPNTSFSGFSLFLLAGTELTNFEHSEPAKTGPPSPTYTTSWSPRYS